MSIFGQSTGLFFLVNAATPKNIDFLYTSSKFFSFRGFQKKWLFKIILPALFTKNNLLVFQFFFRRNHPTGSYIRQILTKIKGKKTEDI